MQSANSKSSKLSRETRTYYPEDYYKRVGYQKQDDARSSVAEKRVDALGQRVRERFNEELEYGDTRSNAGHGFLNSKNVARASLG